MAFEFLHVFFDSDNVKSDIFKCSKGSDSEIHDKTTKITNYLKQLISKMNTTKFSTVIVILMLKSKIIK